MPLQRKPPGPHVPDGLPLIRPEALAAGREPLHGPVIVAMPPGTRAAAFVAGTALLVLAFAGWFVEVPQRARAVGVLMPPGGFVRVVAPQPGRVEALHVREGERVERGQSLMRVISDGGAVNGDSVAHARLQSLRAELRLQDDMTRQQRAASEHRAQALERQAERLAGELRRATEEIELRQARVVLLAGRLERIRALAAAGNASATQLEEVRLEWLAARAAVADLRREATRIEQEGERLRDARSTLSLESVREQTGQAISAERIARQLTEVEAHVGRDLRAPRAGLVARITARPGQPVQAGQPVATIHRGAERLEAWLYLPSTQAGFLREGQSVELRFDAWPSHVFGTLAGTIVSVSAIALMPSDIDVPLALPGPVFEIRATLRSQSIFANGRRWPLVAGTAVRADLVRQHYRLYEWLFSVGRPGSSPPADA